MSLRTDGGHTDPYGHGPKTRAAGNADLETPRADKPADQQRLEGWHYMRGLLERRTTAFGSGPTHHLARRIIQVAPVNPREEGMDLACGQFMFGGCGVLAEVELFIDRIKVMPEDEIDAQLEDLRTDDHYDPATAEILRIACNERLRAVKFE